MPLKIEVRADEVIWDLRSLPEEVEKARKTAAKRLRVIQYREALKVVAENTEPPTDTEVLRSNRRVYSAVSRRDPGNLSLWVGVQPILYRARRSGNVYITMDNVEQALENDLIPQMADYYQQFLEEELQKAVRQ